MMPRLLLILSVLALTVIGCVMIYSASIAEAASAVLTATEENPAGDSGNALTYLTDQLLFVALGVAAAAVLWKFLPCSIWRGPMLWVVWGIAMALLVLTAVMGIAALGATRWLTLGPISLQPSEFAKIALVLVAARLFSDYRDGTSSVRDMLVRAFVLIVIPVAIIFTTQSDLGTTVIIAVGILAVMWMGEAPLKLIGGICVLGLIFVVAATVFTGYRSRPHAVPQPVERRRGRPGERFPAHSLLLRVLRGRPVRAWAWATRARSSYLPEAETDFIFAVIGEELGMVGALVVIALFLVLLYAGMRIAKAAADDFGAMVAGSCTLMLVFQAFLNIGCVVGLLPTTGKPLPFVSSGGSSLIATFIMVGLILSVSKEAGGPSIYERRRADLRVVRAADSSPSVGRNGEAYRGR